MAADSPVTVAAHERSRVAGVDVEALLGRVPALLLRWDGCGGCTQADARPADEAAGDLSDRLAGAGWLDALHPDDAERAERLVGGALAGERGREEGVRLRSGRRWAVLRAEPATGGEPGAHGVLVGASRSLGDTARLARLIEGFNRLRRPEEIVRSVLDEGLALIGGVTASIHVLSERGDSLVVAGSSGVPEDVLRQRSGSIPLDAPLPAPEVLRTGEMITIRTHAERHERFPYLEEILPIEFTPAFVAVPLFDGDRRPFGVLAIGFADERDLPDAERAFLLDVAAHCALAIDRARMTAIAERNQQRLAFLNELNEALSSTLELSSTLRRLSEMCVPRLADWCVVRIGGRASSGEPRTVVGASHVEPGLVPELARLAGEIPRELDRAGELGEALAAGRPLLLRSGAAGVLAGIVGPGGDDRLAAVGAESVAVFPLAARGSLLGAMAFGNRAGRPIGDDDLELIESVVSRAATLVDNARLFHEQSAVARALQDSLLPGSLPAVPGLELGARYRPAGRGLDVGGDFYDAFQADANWWIVAVGDVCGHGVEAAAMTGLVRHTIRARAMAGAMPSVILTRLNEMLLRQADEQAEASRDVVLASPRFCTVLVGAVQPTARGVDIILCLGGHPQPLVRRNDGEVAPVGVPGTLLGVTPETSLVDSVVHLDPGETLVCFTDGLTDRRSGPGLFGEQGIAEALARGAGLAAPALAGLIESAAVSYTDDEPADDMAVITLRASLPADR
jgi:serine phosphatase RsbU (regulator of sigma subunit)/PAS domain-containing protein